MNKTPELITLRNTTPNEVKRVVNALVENARVIKGSYATREEVQVSVQEAVASSDNNPPVNPSNLVATKYENRNRLDWTSSTSSDTRVTYIYRATEEGGTQTQIGQVAYPTDHYEDFNVQPKQSYWYYIQCADEAPNLSEMVPATDGDNVVLGTTLPAPATLTADAWTQDDLNMAVDPVDDFGVSGYRWVIVGRRTEETAGPSYSYSFTKNGEDGAIATSVTVRVYALDEDGVPSDGYIEQAFTHALPGAINDLAAARDTNDLGFRLTWTLSEDPCVIGYDILVNGSVIESSYASNEYLYKIIPVAGTYVFGIQSINKFGQASVLRTYTVVVTGPGMPTNLSIKVLDNWANVFWDAPTISAGQLPIAEYAIYKQAASETYVEPLATINSTVYPDLEYLPGEYRYFVQAIDIAGNTSDLASATCVIESPNFQLLTDVWEDFDDATLVNFFQRDDGVLIGPVDTDETYEQHFTNNGFTTIQDFIDAGYIYNIEPTPLSASYSYELDYGTVINQATNIISTSDIDNHDADIEHYVASKELSGDSYSNEVNDTKLNTSGFQFTRTRLELTSDGTEFCYINTRRLQLSSKKRSESHSFSVSTAGVPDTVVFDTPFISIVSVSASLKYAAGTGGRVVEWDDGSGTPIPSIDMYVFEGGANSTGEGTVTVEGY